MKEEWLRESANEPTNGLGEAGSEDVGSDVREDKIARGKGRGKCNS